MTRDELLAALAIAVGNVASEKPGKLTDGALRIAQEELCAIDYDLLVAMGELSE